MTRWSTLLPCLGLAASLLAIAGMLRQQSRLRTALASNAIIIEARRRTLALQHARIVTFDATWGTDAEWSIPMMYLPAPRIGSNLRPPLIRVAAANTVRIQASGPMNPWPRRRG